jgi:hypothetical protein
MDCDPEHYDEFMNCVTVELELPTRSAVLLIGRVHAYKEFDSDHGIGYCYLTIGTDRIADSGVRFAIIGDEGPEYGSLAIVTPALGPGRMYFGIDCNESSGIYFRDVQLNAVALG